jgi:anion-transporting  ArsA/GET3 family ATPase
MSELKPTLKNIDDIIKSRKILITCGTGGVGKTTLSAAIAMRAALLGKKVVVITIDPAKRLANSLGLHVLDDQPTDLTPQIKAVVDKVNAAANVLSPSAEFPAAFTGSLVAIVPDTRKTFENFVTELAPNQAVADRVMNNPIFQIFAKEFSGTNEYMALERLLSIYKSSAYDFIVLDTPPSRNTLAFLDAPRLLAQFFDEKIIRWLILPANKILAAGVKKALGILERLTGAGFMTNLFDFASSLFEVQVNFTASLKKITLLLESPEVGFMMVTTPTMDAIDEAKHFIASVHEHRFSFDGVILNRTLGYLDSKTSVVGYESAFEVMRDLQARELRVFENLIKTEIPICAKLPELARDVHSLEDLFYVAMALNAKNPATKL